MSKTKMSFGFLRVIKLFFTIVGIGFVALVGAVFYGEREHENSLAWQHFATNLAVSMNSIFSEQSESGDILQKRPSSVAVANFLKNIPGIRIIENQEVPLSESTLNMADSWSLYVVSKKGGHMYILIPLGDDSGVIYVNENGYRETREPISTTLNLESLKITQFRIRPE